LFNILGFEYEEFVESFYLAQREITTPHPHSQAVKIMAGVAPMQKVTAGLHEEIAERQELVGEIKAEWDSIDRDVNALGIQEGRMVELEDKRHQTSEQLEQIQALADEIRSGQDGLIENTGAIKGAQRSKGRTGILRYVILLLALAAAGLWALLSYGSELPQAETARELLVRNVPQWDESRTIWIGYLAAGLGLLFVLLWIRVAALKRRIARLSGESAELGAVLERAREIDIEPIAEEGDLVEDDTGSREYDDEELDDETLHSAVPERPEYAELESLRRMFDAGETSVDVTTDYCERELSWLGYIGDQMSAQLSDLDGEVDEEQNRLQEAFNLSDVLNGLTDKREEVEERIEDRRRALELLDGAVAQMSNNFNRDVKDLVGRMLPLFTDGSYEHLQIDQDLKVRVFSSEKRDFMDLEEVSSGTQRQIMLALRLALSKKLLSRTVKGKQFAFLDEPFAFFDDRRTRKALQSLTDLGDDISQVWIVAQDFPEKCEVKFDTKITCERDSNVLKVES
jgi:exonuclease SbcC